MLVQKLLTKMLTAYEVYEGLGDSGDEEITQETLASKNEVLLSLCM